MEGGAEDKTQQRNLQFDDTETELGPTEGDVNGLDKDLREVGNAEEAGDQPCQAAGDELVS